MVLKPVFNLFVLMIVNNTKAVSMNDCNVYCTITLNINNWSYQTVLIDRYNWREMNFLVMEVEQR